MKDDTKTLNKVVQIDETRIQGHCNEMVLSSVEETLVPCWMPKPIDCVGCCHARPHR